MSQLSEAIERIVVAQGLATLPPGNVWLWSNPLTWVGQVPQNDSNPVIPDGMRVLLDVSTNNLASLRNDGVLIWPDDRDVQLNTVNFTGGPTGLEISGQWTKESYSAGTFPTPLTPNTRRNTLNLMGDRLTTSGNPGGGPLKIGITHTGSPGSANTPTGNNAGANDNFGFQRAAIYEDGYRRLINSYRPAILKAKLAAHANKGQTSITLDQGVFWEAGDKFVLESTDYIGATDAGDERCTVAANTNGSTVVTLQAPLQFNHWGVLQYPTDTGISLTPGLFTDGSAADYTGSISGSTLTITASTGTITVGQRVTGAGVKSLTYILAPGGVANTWIVSQAHTPALASTALKIKGMRATSEVATVLDQRAKAMLLTRRHTVQGANDSEWTGKKFGGHTMGMGLGLINIEYGVQYIRCGQQGMQGRYPIHDHMNAFVLDSNGAATGAYRTNPYTGLADGRFAPGQRITEECAVYDSSQRIHSWHGCRGSVFRNCVGDNIAGHAYFMEDGSETDNTWDSCHVTRVVSPDAGMETKTHDANGQSVGFWITNMDNHFVHPLGYHNGGSGCVGGVVIVVSSEDRAGFPGGCFGASSQVPISPAYTPPTDWQGFDCHSSGGFQMQAFTGLIDEAGNVLSSRILANTTHRFTTNNDLNVANIFTGDILWKGKRGAYGNNQFNPRYVKRTLADCNDSDFTGNTNFGEQEHCLFVRQSLNSANPPDYSLLAKSGTISYHGSLIPMNCSVFGYEVTGVPTLQTYADRFLGVLYIPVSYLSMLDTYLEPLYVFSKQMVNMRFTGAVQAFIGPGPSLQAEAPFSTWSGGAYSPSRAGPTAQAIWDYWGDLFGAGADRYAIPDHPFITTGAADLTSINNTAGTYIGMRSTSSKMLGLQILDNELLSEAGTNMIGKPFAIQRVNPADLTDIVGARLTMRDRDTSGIVGQGGESIHFALPAGSWVRFLNPVTATQYSRLAMIFSAAKNESDFLVMGVPWSNGRAFQGGDRNGQSASVASRAALEAAASGAYFRDTATQIVWVKTYTNSFTNGTGDVNANGTLFRNQNPYFRNDVYWGQF